mgnify:CR=1 FL=1
MKNLNDLTKEDLHQLRKEIVLFSIFISDYENSFEIPPEICAAFFEGYGEYLGELMADDGYSSDEFWDVLDKYETPENLYDWYYMCEYPFGYDLYLKCLEAPADWVDENA